MLVLQLKRTSEDTAVRPWRAALLFHARYDLGAAGGALAHVSRTCAVAFARDMAGAEAAGDPGDAVALKFMSDRLAFDREVPTPRISPDTSPAKP